jgi:DNA-binding transcriptional LysR family regulator
VSLSVKQLRDFIAVSEAGSISRAAETLFVAQPALSLQIKRLEAELGVQVFVRRARGVELTQAGAELLDIARDAVAAFDSVTSRASALRKQAGGQLEIGFMAHGAGDLTPEIVRRFRARYPAATLSFRQFGFDDSLVGVGRGLVDVGFVIGPFEPAEGVEIRTLRLDPILAVVSSDHPFADLDSVSITDVVQEPFVTDCHAPGLWHDFWLAMHHRPAGPAAVAGEFVIHDDWLEAIRAGRGVSICPEATARHYPWPGIAFVPIPDMEPVAFGIAWRRTRQTPLLLAFVECSEAAAQHAGTSVLVQGARPR